METVNTLGWLVVRLAIAYVYLYALYMNTHDRAARHWLLEHTAYLFPHTPEPRRTLLTKWAASLGMACMLLGGVSVLLGLEHRIGSLLLLVFTAAGTYQHRREREV